jgi:hypothetical protein
MTCINKPTDNSLVLMNALETAMKYAMFAALSLFSLFASANDVVSPAASAAATGQVDQYDYTQDLDIAKVVRVTSASTSNACGPVKAKMEYVDSQGVTHHLEYTRLGEDCVSG